jgi:GT2 family glycosyltransferase
MPRFSIITPVYNPPRDAFELCVSSVLSQTSADWEWCLANDASSDDWVASRLHDLQRVDPRIRVVDRTTNGGIVAASNDAIALAEGEFLVLLDNDDELHSDALSLLAAALDREPTADYMYSDEDKVSPDGRYFDDFAKPVWSPERLLAQNYTSHLSVLRRSLVEQVGRFRAGFDGSQDYDLVLRVIERARSVVNVPQVLYHWRSLPTSTASAASAKPYAFHAAMKAVREHLSRCGVAAEVTEAGPSLARVRRASLHHPPVTIVLPIDETTKRLFGVDTWLADNVARSIVEKTTYNNYRVVIVAAPSLAAERVDAVASRFAGRATVLREERPFNLAQYLNAGIVACTTPHAVLLDQTCEFIDRDWLETLLGYSAREKVACVAPFVVDEFGIIFSAGLGMTSEPHEIGRGRHTSDFGPLGMFAIARECTGVSTRCALVDLAAMKSVGGFNPEYATRWFDFDLMCKLRRHGLHSIITPLAMVRTFDDEMTFDEEELFARRWGRLYGDDPYTRIDTRLAEKGLVSRRLVESA